MMWLRDEGDRRRMERFGFWRSWWRWWVGRKYAQWCRWRYARAFVEGRGSRLAGAARRRGNKPTNCLLDGRWTSECVPLQQTAGKKRVLLGADGRWRAQLDRRLRHFFKGTKCLSIVGVGAHEVWFFGLQSAATSSTIEMLCLWKKREETRSSIWIRWSRVRAKNERERIAREDVFQSCLCERRMRIDDRALFWLMVGAVS